MIPVILLSILASAFFSGMEIAFISSNRMHLELERKKNTWLSKLMIYLADRPQRFIATMLIGNNIALVVYGIFMGNLIMQHLPSAMGEVTQLLIQTIISTLIILVTAEFLPKIIFSIYSNELFKFFVFPVYIIFHIFRFFTAIVIWISNIFLKIAGEEQTLEDELFLKDELKYFISESLTDAGEEEVDSEVQIFHNALEFSEIKVRECMVPRSEIFAVKIDSDIETVREKFIETGYSKIIVFNKNIDDIVGYIHAFDLFKKPKTVKSCLLPVEFVHETEFAKQVMNELIKGRKSLAIVVDEYGGTSGMLTIEDVVEELFGEIEDEHDISLFTEKQISEDEFDFAARLEIDYLNENYNLNLPESDAYETLGGLVINTLEEIPAASTSFTIGEFVMTVTKVSESKIEEINIKRNKD